MLSKFHVRQELTDSSHLVTHHDLLPSPCEQPESGTGKEGFHSLLKPTDPTVERPSLL